jgi:hypothetical protein
VDIHHYCCSKQKSVICRNNNNNNNSASHTTYTARGATQEATYQCDDDGKGGATCFMRLQLELATTTTIDSTKCNRQRRLYSHWPCKKRMFRRPRYHHDHRRWLFIERKTLSPPQPQQQATTVATTQIKDNVTLELHHPSSGSTSSTYCSATGGGPIDTLKIQKKD